MASNGIARLSDVPPEEREERIRLGVLPWEDLRAAQERMAKLREILQPRDVLEESQTKMIYFRSQDLERASCAHNAKRALYVEKVATQERIEAIDLGSRLFFNPRGPSMLYGCELPYTGKGTRTSESGMGDVNNEPAGLVKRMERTAAGCRWMVESWTRLRERLEPEDFWIPYHKFIAIRLMGRQPLDALADPVVSVVFEASHAVQPHGNHPFVELRGELTADEMDDFLSQWRRRRRPLVNPGDAVTGRQVLLALVEPAISRLSAMAEEHEQRPDARRALEQAYDESPEGRRLERCERECARSIEHSLRGLRNHRREMDRRARQDGGRRTEDGGVEGGDLRSGPARRDGERMTDDGRVEAGDLRSGSRRGRRPAPNTRTEDGGRRTIGNRPTEMPCLHREAVTR